MPLDNPIVPNRATDILPANAAHPNHHAFRWGVFLAFLAIAATKAGPLVGMLTGNEKINAALQGGGSILGELLQAELAAGGDPLP